MNISDEKPISQRINIGDGGSDSWFKYLAIQAIPWLWVIVFGVVSFLTGMVLGNYQQYTKQKEASEKLIEIADRNKELSQIQEDTQDDRKSALEQTLLGMGFNKREIKKLQSSGKNGFVEYITEHIPVKYRTVENQVTVSKPVLIKGECQTYDYSSEDNFKIQSIFNNTARKQYESIR